MLKLLMNIVLPRQTRWKCHSVSDSVLNRRIAAKARLAATPERSMSCRSQVSQANTGKASWATEAGSGAQEVQAQAKMPQ